MSYTYNTAGGLGGIYVDGKAGALANYGYNDAGQVQLIALENGTSVVMTYDSTYGRLSSLVDRDKNNQTMTSFGYTYNNDGYVTQVARENGDTINYQYDGVGRLMDEWRKTSGAALVYRNRFQYDSVGNRTQWWAQTVGDATTYNYTYNTLNQLTQRYWTKASINYTEDYSYDLNGNLTQKDEKKAGALQLRWLYDWDDEDRLVSVVKKNGAGTVLLTVEYAYCPACGGNRTQKRVWNGTKTDQNLVKWLQYETEGLNQLRVDEKWESQSDGNNYLDSLDPWRTVRVSYGDPDGPMAMIKEIIYGYSSQATGTPSGALDVYYHYDSIEVVAGLSDANGVELVQFESDAFGSWDGQGTQTTRRITGKEYDLETGLYFFDARWYDPLVGRFISRDPVGLPERLPPNVARGVHLGTCGLSPVVGDEAAPQDYALAANNPLYYVDPSGMKLFSHGDYCGLSPDWRKWRDDPEHPEIPRPMPIPDDCIDRACQYHDFCYQGLPANWTGERTENDVMPVENPEGEHCTWYVPWWLQHAPKHECDQTLCRDARACGKDPECRADRDCRRFARKVRAKFCPPLSWIW